VPSLGTLDRSDDLFKHKIEVHEYVAVPEPQHAEPATVQLSVSLAVAGFGVMLSVDFDDQPLEEAYEVDDVWADRMLSSEANPEVLSPDRPPQQPLGVGLIAAERPCE